MTLRYIGFGGAAATYLLCVTGCGLKPMGEKAPAFGSSSKVATTAGFLDGTWKQVVDRSTARANTPDFSGIMPNCYLEFHQNHTCEFEIKNHVAHMTWAELGDGITLTVVDVDGKNPQLVKSELDGPRHSQNPMRTLVLEFAESVHKLQLMADKKRLFEPASVRADGTSFMGTATWVRMKT